jgi:hypothetical protein
MRRILSALLVAGTLLAGGAPTPAVAKIGESVGMNLRYSVVATGSVNSALTTMTLDTTLTITAPEGGMNRLVLGVEPKGLRAWTTRGTYIDGVATTAVSWTGTMGLTLDFAAAPWSAGSTHTVRVVGLIDWTKSIDKQGHLRRVGSLSTGNVTLTAGDFMPLPIEAAYYPTFSDAVSAVVAEKIRLTLNIARNIRGYGVAMAGTRISGSTTATVGRSWTYEIANARSYAFAIGQNYATTYKTITIPIAGGGTGPVVVRAYGASSTQRLTDLTNAANALTKLTTMYGPGPYTDYKLVNVTAGGFSHEFPGLVFIGSSFTGASRTGVVRHEIAHEWWYGTSVNDQAEDGWMDESLAQYSQYRMAGLTTGPAYNCTRAIDGPNRSTAGFYSAFFGTNSLWECVYKKGARFWMGVGALIGFEKLDGCLGDYLQANRFVRRGPVVLVQAIRDCDERTLPLLEAYLSPATVAATN